MHQIFVRASGLASTQVCNTHANMKNTLSYSKHVESGRPDLPRLREEVDGDLACGLQARDTSLLIR